MLRTTILSLAALATSFVVNANENPYLQHCLMDAPSTMTSWKVNPLNVMNSLAHADLAVVGTVTSVEKIKEEFYVTGEYIKEEKVSVLVTNAIYDSNQWFQTYGGKTTDTIELTLRTQFGGDVSIGQYPMEKGKSYILHTKIHEQTGTNQFKATVYPCGPTTSLAEDRAHEHVDILDSLISGVLVVEPPM
ncbi:hypothetical protein [Algicola sagamiensis]|uniref:hypothetical protein n=1 Tax=Algicola sagamiensis TaxID=163869 RepID=UPI00036C4CC0|nr:hypothetical protein [Algicola sagamiensis]